MTGTLAIKECRTAVSATTSLSAGLRESMFAVGNAELGPFTNQKRPD